MNISDFENVLWQSRCNAGKLLRALIFIPLALFFFMLLIIVFVGYPIFVLAIIALIVITAVILTILSQKNRWLNPQLIFLATDEGVILTMKSNPSYFLAEYESIGNYTYEIVNDRFATMTLRFKFPIFAGVFGKLNSMTMAKIENFELLKIILENHGICCEQEMKMTED